MSTHLLPVKSGNEQLPVLYRNYLPNDVQTQDIRSIVSCYSHHIVYVGAEINNTKLIVYKFNTFTNTIAPIGDISWVDLGGKHVGGILVDDSFIYVSSVDVSVIRVFDITSLSLIGSFQYNTGAFGSFGKLQWYDSTTICATVAEGIVFFDTQTRTYTAKTHGTSYAIYDMAVGKKLIIFTISGVTDNVVVYSINDDTFTNITLSSSGVCAIGYENGKFYVANSAQHLSVIDENTRNIIDDFITANSSPQSVCVDNGVVFMTCNNSNRVHVIDMNTSPTTQLYLIAPWSISARNVDRNFIPSASDSCFYIPYITFMGIDYEGRSKYNMGFKYNQFVVVYNLENEPDFTYNHEYVEFTESYVTIKDGKLTYEFDDYDTENHIKSISVSKSDYNIFKTFTLKMGDD